ncbi:phosphoesterase RecJ-like protein [Anseongella ginsenosidimutans]|uniref:Phosphoesterase RecJ-like protein n=1 Tax=Anseongella ginsenosidimutans TaxID=496056 RepID=A0A4R3KN65_9SPHI|nr:bifunctional oligoribonuclease/PAP phosphatase NrnA [Anseongella ginsenosidimutans]QEC54085.1 bifunctional oligoribonuclease/PAP phosphatase NrnA [Anseongella ginsenosidimutans]TCS85145.1 phosphoesterase RecJ-like protein [Anseongella ginsenosidimutans]
MESYTLLKPALMTPRRIVITTHHKPDGDAMGSSLALYHYLLQKGHTVHVITPSDYPYFLHWLPGNAEVVVFTAQQQKAKELVKEAELIFCLDFNNLKRINELGEVIAGSSAPKVLIDHHLEPENFDQFRLWNSKACATAELIYEFITGLGDSPLIDKAIATCLYTGIMTDTGSFRFPSTTAAVHRIIASLIDAGAENSRIHELIYDTSSESRLRFLGYCLSEKLEVLPAYRTGLIAVSREELERFQVTTGDTEGIVNYALSIYNIKFAALIIDRSEVVKLSFRSKGEFPANEIAKKYFEGGGHRNAAGGQSKDALDEVVKKFKSVLEEYKELLNQ